jgi:hypothetical protein
MKSSLMDDQTSLPAIVEALKEIRDELRLINRQMSQRPAPQAAVAPEFRPSGGSFRPSGPPRSGGRPPFRGGSGGGGFRRPDGPSSGGGYRRPEGGAEGASSEEGGGGGFRFSKKPSFGGGRPAGKGKFAPKKGGGYPKKAR